MLLALVAVVLSPLPAHAASKHASAKKTGHSATARSGHAAAAHGKKASTTRGKSSATAGSRKSSAAYHGKSLKTKGSVPSSAACRKKAKHCRATLSRRADAAPRMVPTPAAEASTADVAESAEGAAIENPETLAPFFARLAAHDAAPAATVVRILHYGDSHTAADMFTGEMRARLQQRFGDGGTGFSAAGYPFLGYRIHGTRRAQSSGWTTGGTHLGEVMRGESDGRFGIAGLSLSTSQPDESVLLEAPADKAELYYLQQPGGGRIELRCAAGRLQEGSSAASVATLSTDGELAAKFFALPPDCASAGVVPPTNAAPQENAASPEETARPDATPQANAAAPQSAVQISAVRHFEARTLDAAPVRLFGFTAENNAGLTYEAMGINGAEAALMLHWEEKLQSDALARRAPALIVLDYGTNEAANHNWEYGNYKAMLGELLARIHRALPGVPVLILGPTDRDLRAGRRRWANFHGTERITQAQRDFCKEQGCAFWDQQAAMGGWGSMSQWVRGGLAQADHTHLTAPGYIRLADALSAELLRQYEAYRKSSAR